MEKRLKTAIAFLKDKESFRVGDLLLAINEAEGMQVTGWSQYTNIRNLSKAICLEELSEVKQIFSDMLSSSEELRMFVIDKEIEYHLNYDDNGKASISICSEKHQVLKWYIDLK